MYFFASAYFFTFFPFLSSIILPLAEEIVLSRSCGTNRKWGNPGSIIPESTWAEEIGKHVQGATILSAQEAALLSLHSIKMASKDSVTWNISNRFPNLCMGFANFTVRHSKNFAFFWQDSLWNWVWNGELFPFTVWTIPKTCYWFQLSLSGYVVSVWRELP